MKFARRSVRRLALIASGCLALGVFAAEPSGSTATKASLSSGSAEESSTQKESDLPANRFRAIDLFDLETATEPQISPDGARVVFVRNFNDIMKDRKRSNLWIINYEGSDLRPLTDGNENDNSPRWSPDGQRLLYASSRDAGTQIYARWMDSGQIARVNHCAKSPGSMEWSPDGRWIAFSMSVPDETKPFVEMPAKPEGAE